MHDDAEYTLDGGNVGAVVRVGDTVRRTAGPWTASVQGLLHHVRSGGFDLAPEPLGLDDRGREVLSYLDGDTVGSGHPWPDWAWSEALLDDVSDAVRRYHAAVTGYSPPDAIWRGGQPGATGPILVGHNDLAPYNVVTRAGRLVGIIDWDFAGLATPEWELAFMAWHWGPLHHPALAQDLGWFGTPIDAAARVRRLCDRYGMEDRTDLVDLVTARVASSRDGIETRAAAGEPAFVRMLADGHADAMTQTIAHVRGIAADLDAALR